MDLDTTVEDTTLETFLQPTSALSTFTSSFTPFDWQSDTISRNALAFENGDRHCEYQASWPVIATNDFYDNYWSDEPTRSMQNDVFATESSVTSAKDLHLLGEDTQLAVSRRIHVPQHLTAGCDVVDEGLDFIGYTFSQDRLVDREAPPLACTESSRLFKIIVTFPNSGAETLLQQSTASLVAPSIGVQQYPDEIVELIRQLHALPTNSRKLPLRTSLKSRKPLIRKHFCSRLGILKPCSQLRQYLGDTELLSEEWWTHVTVVQTKAS